MNWMKYRLLYFSVSLICIGIGLFSLIKWGVKTGVDFSGGTLWELGFSQDVSTETLVTYLKDKGYSVTSASIIAGTNYVLRMPNINEQQKKEVLSQLNEEFPGVEELKFENVGPTIGPELIKKTIYAICLSAALILMWVAYQFRSLKFGTCAVLAMLHDSLILIGSISLLGHFFGAEVDFLFVTAMLTILSFSVHDTIVVYDRIRESQNKFSGSFRELADKAVTETMTRSLNNSFTIIFMLVALVLLGGTSIRWFAVILLIGTISGTYSSPFVAVPLLLTWNDLTRVLKEKRFFLKRR